MSATIKNEHGVFARFIEDFNGFKEKNGYAHKR